MKQGIYLKINNKLNNETVSVIATKMIYALFIVWYVLKKICAKGKIINIDSVEAKNRIENICPKPLSKVVCARISQNSMIDLSIIIPVYNYESVLEKMIKSVINQNTTYRYEVILVDDGSNVSAKEILYKYQNEKNIIVIYQENQGISGARNTGLSIASGKYILFVDCDDIIHEDMVEKMVSKAYKTNADITMCAHALVKEKDGIEFSRREDRYPKYNLEGYEKDEYIMNFPGFPWGKVYKRELFENVGFPVNYWYEDTVIQFLIFRLAKTFEYIPEVLYDYKWYEGNFSKVQSQSKSRVLERYWIVEYMLEENERLSMEKDEVLYKTIIRHLGSYLYHAVEKLDDAVKRDVFSVACDLVERYRPEYEFKINFKLSELEKAFKYHDYARWELASKIL